jgi:hypothetical protein
MPISHPLKTIFVHIPKTGGTSVEAVLGMHGDKTDIGVRPYFNQSVDREHLYGQDLQHMTVLQLKNSLNDTSIFEQYFKFAIVRNPWERIVSTFAWTNQKWARGEKLARDEFARAIRQVYSAIANSGDAAQALRASTHLRPQVSYLVDGNMRVLVDYIARHETLGADWRHICARLGLNIDLPERMKSHHSPYRDYYDDDTRGMVAELYAEDTRSLGYEF